MGNIPMYSLYIPYIFVYIPNIDGIPMLFPYSHIFPMYSCFPPKISNFGATEAIYLLWNVEGPTVEKAVGGFSPQGWNLDGVTMVITDT